MLLALQAAFPAKRKQPRAMPWADILTPLQGEIPQCKQPRAFLALRWCSGGKAGRPWADILTPLQGEIPQRKQPRACALG